MQTTRLSNKGQIVIPKQVRSAHGWEPGLEFMVEDTGDGIKLKPVTPFMETKAEELVGSVGYKGPKKSLREMEVSFATFDGSFIKKAQQFNQMDMINP